MNILHDIIADEAVWKQILLFVAITVVIVIFHFFLSKINRFFLKKVFTKKKNRFGELLLKHTIGKKILWMIFPITYIATASYMPAVAPFLLPLSKSGFALIFVVTFASLLNAVNDFYNSIEKYHGRSIKGFLEIIKIAAYILSGFVIIGILTGQSPWALASGIGALTAVIILIFRDTILSFVASLQITSNDLVRMGDWITVPSVNADGNVVDIALHTVKVQNWDKTVTVIPTHKLLDQTFKNWRSMLSSGSRRIKRSIHIDVNSIKFCNEAMLNKFAKIPLLHDYIENKRETMDKKEHPYPHDGLTNIGIFRIYIEEYLKTLDTVRKDMLIMVRQLPSGENGLPLELYLFAATVNWKQYEKIQADIFDHLLAVVDIFELRIFQSPSGRDFQALT